MSLIQLSEKTESLKVKSSLLAMGTWSKDLFSYCAIWKSVEQVMIPGRQLKTLNIAVISLKPEQINADRSDQNEKQGAQP